MSDAVPFEFLRLDHVVLRARNADALTRFYCDVLGCRREREVAELGLVQLRAGESLIDIVDAAGRLGQAGGPPPAADGGHNVDHLCLRVAPFDPDAIAGHLGRHGVEPSDVRHVYGAEGFGPSIYLNDPEGNTVELKGPAEPASGGS